MKLLSTFTNRLRRNLDTRYATKKTVLRLQSSLDRSSERVSALESDVAELRRQLRDNARIVTETVQATQSLMQSELRLWQSIDQLSPTSHQEDKSARIH